MLSRPCVAKQTAWGDTIHSTHLVQVAPPGIDQLVGGRKLVARQPRLRKERPQLVAQSSQAAGRVCSRAQSVQQLPVRSHTVADPAWHGQGQAGIMLRNYSCTPTC